MIKRVHISGYKSFSDLDIELQPLTVIFGPNASGKSNFLDALFLLSQAATSKNLKRAFEGHRGLPLESFNYGEEGYDRLLQRDRVSLTFEVDVELSDTTVDLIEKMVKEKRKGIDAQPSKPNKKKIISERLLRYRLQIEALPDSGYLRVGDERLCALNRRNGQEKQSRRPFMENTGGRLSLRMEGQAHPTYHEIGLDHTIISTPLYEPHYPHMAAMKRELSNWHTFYLEPRTLMRDEVPLAEIQSIGPRGENLPAFLNTLRNENRKAFDDLNKTLALALPRRPQLEVERSREGRVGLNLSENGQWFSARQISEGTLRLIGLLAAIHPLNPSTLVAYEEPENGVHPSRLKIISDLLKNAASDRGKQLIVTTHSPILPTYFPGESLYVSKREAGKSVISPFASHGPVFKQQEIETALEDAIVRGDYGG